MFLSEWIIFWHCPLLIENNALLDMVCCQVKVHKRLRKNCCHLPKYGGRMFIIHKKCLLNEKNKAPRDLLQASTRASFVSESTFPHLRRTSTLCISTLPSAHHYVIYLILLYWLTRQFYCGPYTTHTYCTILWLPSLWHVYFLFLHHRMVATKSINLRHIIKGTHNELQYFLQNM